MGFHGGPVQQTGTNAAKKGKADSDCTTLKNLCKATLDAKCVKKKGKEKDKDAQGQCQCHAKRGDNTKLIPKPKPSSKNTAPTPPSPSPKTDSGGGWTGIVVFILLLAIVGGVGFASTKGYFHRQWLARLTGFSRNRLQVALWGTESTTKLWATMICNRNFWR